MTWGHGMQAETITKHEFAPPLTCWSNDDNLKVGQHAFAACQETSDGALIKSLAAGNKRAVQVLFTRHNMRIFRFVLCIVRDEALAEDLVSEVFLEALRNASKFEGRCKVSTWLLAIARNKAITVVRRCSDAQLDEELATTTENPSDNPETTFEKNRSEVLRKCLTQLSPMHREIIDLVYYHEQSVAEVALIIGTRESTVKTRMFYARSQIEKLLKKSGIDKACL
jgi:RNA polymerase sigma-70 factor (ECF subfamily)